MFALPCEGRVGPSQIRKTMAAQARRRDVCNHRQNSLWLRRSFRVKLADREGQNLRKDDMIEVYGGWKHFTSRRASGWD